MNTVKRATPVQCKAPFVVWGALALAACTVPVPEGPTVLALPPTGKNLAQFEQEDHSCRLYAAGQIGAGPKTTPAPGPAARAGGGAPPGPGPTGFPPAGAANAAQASVPRPPNTGPHPTFAGASQDDLQRLYDIAYAQCMAASGNRLMARSSGHDPQYAAVEPGPPSLR